ncbi:triose-phosphate isomerase [Phragmitibacter flavus]|uniref:Triosephosphate isomerase n=1 Tax=Phragmitibacter flavus TaxID=2576071 RepID=A0A5R8KFE7_9BACT|nr:triose-phosphate isomerase [Phragmitibacter flavus]TLD71022.1 triose-phosphate isomerase [Phragmitibacter flavus]
MPPVFRKPIVAANWKMNNTPTETEQFLRSFLRLIPEKCPIQIVVTPPFVSLPKAHELMHNVRTEIVELGAQNMSQYPSGAYTGEINAMMLKEVGVRHVILGHSERRAIFGETSQMVNAKVLAALEARLHPIVCVGETLEERDAGRINEVLESQMRESLATVGSRRLMDVVVAYEPVWAIGTGRTASPEQAQEAHAFIRSVLASMFDQDTANKVRIQYGGSVKPSNMDELISQPDVDGALVGGASLESGSFYEIVKAVINYVNDNNKPG